MSNTKNNKEYVLAKNKEFLKWLDKHIKNGYNCYIGLDELQELINNITFWYKMKYSNNELKYFEGVKSCDFDNMRTVPNIMSTEQLLSRLPYNQACLMKCDYSARGWSYVPVYDDGKMVGSFEQISVKLKDKTNDNEFFLKANRHTGEIYNSEDEYVEDYMVSSTTLDQALEEFKQKYSDILEFSELEESVYNHNCDVKLRDKVLQFVALNLLCSEKYDLEQAHIRVEKLVEEFKNDLGINIPLKKLNKVKEKTKKKSSK